MRDVLTYNDYYPFGMLLPNRHESSAAYRYGFQGQEKDDEIKGEGNSMNYKFRMHDPRVGRFFAVDPLANKYPHYTPYSFSGNKVIHAIELEGLEELILNYDLPSFDLYHTFIHVVQKDDILNETLLKSINKPELADKYKVHFGSHKFQSNTLGGKTYSNKFIRGFVKAADLYTRKKDFYAFSEFEDDVQNTMKILDALGITSKDYKKILNDKNTKHYGVITNTNNPESEVDKLKTIAHEIDFHLTNYINFEVTGDEKYNKTGDEEHIEAHGKDYYEKNGVHPSYSPPKGEVPKGTKADILFKKMEKAYKKNKKG